MDSQERKFVLECAYNEWKINMYVFDKTDSLIEVFDRENPVWKEENRPSGKEDMPREQAELLSKIREECNKKNCPVVLPDRDGIYYMAFYDEEKLLYVLGPVSTDTISFSQLISFRKSHLIANPKFRIPRLPFAKAFNLLVMLYYMITGKQVSEEAIFAESNLDDGMNANVRLEEEEVLIYEIQSSTEENRRLAYRDELIWTAEIESGIRKETKKKLQSENLKKLEQVGKLSNKNAYKQFEYMVISSACLACRAAIRGGVNVYDAYALADLFYQKTSLCKNVMELLQLYTQIADEFSSQVRKAKENRSSGVVEQCKDYIARNRTKKFSLPALAEALGKNPSYLSRIFSEQTGKTLQEYALSHRLEAGANLLKYSDRSIGEISEYLNFSSQSYFGEHFKRQYGRTPAAYRRVHKIRDFKQ